METSESVRRTARATEPGAVTHEPELVHHPGPGEYIKIAVILAVLTAMEVGLYYITAIPGGIYVTLLAFFMVAKFSLVVLWFMHLRFDSRIFRRLFVAGLVLALLVYAAVLIMFRVVIGR